MITTCTKCHAAFDTTTEDAYDPDRLCPPCYIGAALRYVVDAQDGQYAAANRWVTRTLNVHLSRNGQDWRVELCDETPIPRDEAHRWARACGAPDGTPVLSACGEKVYVAQWEDDHYEAARPIVAVYVQGSHP